LSSVEEESMTKKAAPAGAQSSVSMTLTVNCQVIATF
jgi:hypothetical protein